MEDSTKDPLRGGGGLPHWAVTALAQAVERLKPAHLAVAVLPTAELETADGSALHGGALTIMTAEAPPLA